MVQRKMFNLLKVRKMNELSKIWEDIVNYCQSLFDKNQDIKEDTTKQSKVVKKKKTSVKKSN